MGTSAADPPDELWQSEIAARLADRHLPRAVHDRLVLPLALRLEGGPFRSATARRLLLAHHGVAVGAYSYGACLRPGALPAGVTVGRYVSMAGDVAAFRRNHPTDRLSMHPYFYNASLGSLAQDTVDAAPLEIAPDAWLGHRCIVLPGCRRIGIGAVVGAGAVVTRDVPDLAVVTGNPARVQRLRFPDEVCDAVLRSRWWDRPVEQLLAELPAMVDSLDHAWSTHPLLGHRAA